MNLELGPAWSTLTGDPSKLQKVYETLMFRDKQAESDLTRFRKNCFFKEKLGATFPGYLEWKMKEETRLKSLLDVYATRWENGRLMVPTGFAHRLASEGCQITDLRNFDQNRRHHRAADSDFVLRKPQREALAAMNASTLQNGLLRIATGAGKTAILQEFFRHIGKRSLFLVPSKPILDQTVRRFIDAFGKNQVGWFSGEGKRHGYITVATYQSVNLSEPSEFDDYAVLAMDESHHVGADTFFHAAMNQVRNATHRFALSADEVRADGGTLLVEAACGPAIYDYPAWRAIDDGYLARPTFATYLVHSTGGKFKHWKTRGKVRELLGEKEAEEYQGPDAGIAYKHWILGNDRLTSFVASMANQMAADGQSVLILIDETEHGEKLCAQLGEEFVDWGFCVGGGKNNEKLLKAFNMRVLKILVATTTLSEGADTVPVDVLFNLLGGCRPKQAVGRALRNETVDGVALKPTSLVIDFDCVNSPVLTRHYAMREEIYRAYRCGDPVVMGSI
jgi:superfamily II DNA or RNA helicase